MNAYDMSMVKPKKTSNIHKYMVAHPTDRKFVHPGGFSGSSLRIPSEITRDMIYSW